MKQTAHFLRYANNHSYLLLPFYHNSLSLSTPPSEQKAPRFLGELLERRLLCLKQSLDGRTVSYVSIIANSTPKVKEKGLRKFTYSQIIYRQRLKDRKNYPIISSTTSMRCIGDNWRRVHSAAISAVFLRSHATSDTNATSLYTP